MATLTENRTAKARRFIDFLDQHLPADADVESVADLSVEQWAEIARMAGEQPPSVDTQACIMIGFRERRRPLDASLLDGIGARG